MTEVNYVYNAIVSSVYDGDTITAEVDLGYFIWSKNTKCRLYGIDTPELRGAERLSGLQSRDRLRELVGDGRVVIESHGRGKYGRWLVTLWKDGTNLNQQLLEEKYADRYPT